MVSAVGRALQPPVGGLSIWHGRVIGPLIDAATTCPVAGLMTGIAIAVFMAGAGESLQYDRSAIADGQLWRWVTGHWTHWNVEHLFWDVLALLALGAMCERADRGRFVGCVAAATVLISAFLWFFDPATVRYRGLSGIDTALLALLGSQWLRQSTRRPGSGVLGAAAMLVLASKLLYEVITDRAVFVAGGAGVFEPVPAVHLVGAVTGLCAGTIAPVLCRVRSRPVALSLDSPMIGRTATFAGFGRTCFENGCDANADCMRRKRPRP